MPHVAEIWRHPIKAHGREAIDEVTLTAGECLPWDRRWAVAHERSCFDIDRPSWQPCQEFSRGAKSPRLQAISVRVDPAYRNLTLSHPDRPDLTIDPDDHGGACEFIQWVMPISNGNRMLPSRLVRAPGKAMTDTDFASVSLINLATHRAIEAELGHDISPLRWRGNLLLDGLEPWAEMDWIGKTLRIGGAELEIKEQITRCMATTANVETGARDADTLGALKSGWDHQECGVYGVVTKSGHLLQGDTVEVV
ncbi:MAG: molybdenum cofactor biosysynthesis protein [Rhodobacteraceae bacterium]|nr:MAG: molybdenum cofactor biosysynthesis protein [Paracoccaceae bacterium]